jgi:hypothetical protein
VEDQESAKQRFRDWVKTRVPDAEYMNICSGPQVGLWLCVARRWGDFLSRLASASSTVLMWVRGIENNQWWHVWVDQCVGC